MIAKNREKRKKAGMVAQAVAITQSSNISGFTLWKFARARIRI